MYKEQQDGDVVTHVSAVEAKGGSKSRVSRNILVVSLFLVIVALVASLALGFFETDRTGADQVTADNTAQSDVR
ncbi:MAG: hypothetical protein V4523_09985 [Pseudomonadota bacterium]